MSEMSLSEQFRLHFQQIKAVCNENPQTLVTFAKERPDFRRLAWDLDSIAGQIELVEAFRKVHPQMSTEFIADWKDYIARWRKPVAYVVASDIKLPEEFGEMPSYEDYAGGRDPYDREPPDLRDEDEFRAEAHDGGAAIQALIDLVADQAHDRIANGIGPDFISNTYKVGTEAIEYYENVMGLDISDAFDRWNGLPTVFVPKHVSDKHGLTAKSGLYALFDQAIRSYVAGAPAAAAAMCRAILELVLKDHYLGDENTNRKSLYHVIEMATERYAFLDGKQLHALREDANGILHDYASSNGSLEIDDSTMLKIFSDLKHYIEKAPEP